MKKYIVIVDGFSTAQYLSYIFKGNNIPRIHILSSHNVPPKFLEQYKIHKSSYDICIEYDGNMENLRKELQKYNIGHIIPGSETGVIIANDLANYFNLATANDLELGEARRDKFLMHEALKKKNVAAMKHCISDNLDEILKWTEQHGQYTVVLKPPASAATEDVHFCHSAEEIKKAFESIMGKTNLLGILNEKVLVQEFLSGEECIANVVVRDGHIFITDVWKSNKINHKDTVLYDFQELVSHHDPLFKVLFDYTALVLDALGIQHGAAHLEIMLTQNGPVLIEIGARLAGGVDPSALTAALGYNPVSMLAESMMNPQGFINMTKQPRLEALNQLYMVYLISDKTGKVNTPFDTNVFEQLPGFHGINFSLKPGDMLHETITLFDSPGSIFLIAEDQSILLESYDRIREIEKTFYANALEIETTKKEEVSPFSMFNQNKTHIPDAKQKLEAEQSLTRQYG